MLKNYVLILCAIFTYSYQINSQSNTCSKDEADPLLDFNSITKCTVGDKADESSATKQNSIAVQVTSRRRIVRKRDAANGVSIDGGYEHKLEDIKKKADIINKLNVGKAKSLEVVPFNMVDDIPLFKPCQSVPIYQQERCFRKELSTHIRKNLRYPSSAYDKGIQGRVLVHFIIDKAGNISDTKIISPYKGEQLGKEAERIIKKLPKFVPAKHEGTAVKVKYGLPINFSIPGVKRTNIKKPSKIENLASVYKFDQLDRIPLFKKCNSDRNSSQGCYNEQLMKHINDNFAYPAYAIDNNIEGKVIVSFIVNKKGQVVNVKAKGPQNTQILENAAKVLIERLPDFKPAKKNGESVNAMYTFPVNFSLD